MTLSSSASIHFYYCCRVPPGNGGYAAVPSILPNLFTLPSNNFILSIPRPSSMVSPKLKLHCLPSSSSMSTHTPNIRDRSYFLSTLKTLQSKKSEDLSDETVDFLLTGLNPKEQTIILKKQKDWRRSLYLFRRMKSTKSYSPNPVHYNVVLRTLGRSLRWDELRVCWIEMADDGVLPTNNTYATLIDVYGKAGLAKEALLWLKHMKSRGVFPDEVSINTAVQVLKDSRQFDLGERLFKGWCDGKVDLDVIDVSFDGLANSSMINPKHFLLTELFKFGGRPPVSQITSVFDRGPQKPRRAATYNTLIDLYGKAGRLKDASDAFLQMLQSGVMPDTLTFNTMINICCSHGHLLEAESLLGKMEERRVYPDTKTFNILMTYHASHGDVDNVLRSYRKMKDCGLHSDLVSFRIICQTLCEKRMISEVEDILDETMKSGSTIDEQSLPVIIKMYINEELLDKAFIFFEKHCNSGNISSKNRAAIIDLYADKGLWKEAEDVFMAKKVGCRKDVVEYNVMIKAYGKTKLYDKALELFELMRHTGPWPDDCTYNSLIQMLSGGDLTDKAREFLTQMRKSGFMPRCETFSSVLSSYCRAGLLSEAVEIYKEMIACSVEPNELVYGSLIDAFSETGRIEEAIKYYSIMEKYGITANCIVLTSLIKAYGKVGSWREAQELYGKMKNLENGPDVIASNCMINLYAGLGMVNEAKLIFDELRRTNRADEVSYATIMYLYKSMGMLNQASDIAQEMQQTGLLTNCSSYNNVMSSYVDNGKLKDCADLLHKMIRQKMLPDTSTFKVLFTLLKKGGFPSEGIFQLESSYNEGKPYARQAIITSIFSTVGLHTFAQKSCEVFVNAGVEIESYAYNSAIGAYGEAGEVDKALNVYMKMQDAGLQPDLVTYVHLAGCYGKAGMVGGLKRIYSLLKYGEIDPSQSLYMSIINAYREAGRDDLADLVNQEMRFSIQTDMQIEVD